MIVRCLGVGILWLWNRFCFFRGFTLGLFAISVELVLLGSILCWLGRSVFGGRVMKLFLFFIIEYIHKLLQNLFVLNIHTGIHVLVVFLKFFFGFGRSLLGLRFVFEFISRRGDGIIFIFVIWLLFVSFLCQFCSVVSCAIC